MEEVFICKFSQASPESNSGTECPSQEESDYIVCEICRSPVCSYHTSSADPTVCVGCFSDSALAATQKPLIDTDGVIHKGRVIEPLGFTYKTLMQRLVDYTEDELIVHIHHVKAQIEEAQRVLDYRRIDLSASSVELEDRHVAKRKKLRLQGVASLANGSKSIAGPDQLPSAKQKQLNALATKLRSVAALLGLPCKTPEDLTRVAAAVKSIGEASAKKQRQAQQATQAKQVPVPQDEMKKNGNEGTIQ